MLYAVQSRMLEKGSIIGPEHGASKIFRERERHKSGFFVGLHSHQGDESFEVLEGKIRFTAAGEQKECGPGYVVFIPAGVEHGFYVVEDACLDVFSEQKMGLFIKVMDGDGSFRTEEVYVENFPSSRNPPPGQTYTSREHVRKLYQTTRHLL
ncbi:cupin domain-containing protein [Cesiribacter sp. SM1]|uniref:cupin domain-containing protein n=1 Tax=Cesiribacter sp. SM1 TaxID=2861196 RepID=UPI001CD3646C|nr:cupin domain-containing protein [Cesiribacter sp. SM1]